MHAVALMLYSLEFYLIKENLLKIVRLSKTNVACLCP